MREKFVDHRFSAASLKAIQTIKHGPSPIMAAEAKEEASKFYVTDDEYAVIYKRKAA